MPHYVFFSWQSDIQNRVGRAFVQSCLDRAIAELQADADVDPADREVAADHDTHDVPGSPPIMETIFGKIDRAAVFVSDLTYVANRIGGGKTPNPNVCIEHGYALKALSWRRVIAVMNTAMGHPDEHELPFDVRHTRRPIAYDLPEGADAEARRAAMVGLVKTLKGALKAIFGDAEARAAMVGPGAAGPHPRDAELLKRVHRQLPQSLRRFLHQHSFGTPYRFSELDLLNEMNADWVGAAFEFQDKPVQVAFEEVRRLSNELGAKVLERIYVMPRSQTMGWPKTDYDVAHGLQPTTLQAIKDMDTKATELSAAIDSFDRLSRERIPVDTGIHAQTGADDSGGEAARVLRDAAEAALNDMAMDAHRGALPEIVTKPRLVLRLAPFAAGEGKRLEPAKVAEAQLRFPPNTTDRVKTDSDGRQWWACRLPAHVGGGPNPETAWRMRLVRPGYLEYETVIGGRIDDDPEILVNGQYLEALIIGNLERMSSIAAELGLGGGALISIGLDGVEDVQLTRARAGGKRIRRPDVYLPIATVEDMREALAPALREQLDILWQTSGWSDGSPSFGDGAWAGYVEGGRQSADFR